MCAVKIVDTNKLESIWDTYDLATSGKHQNQKSISLFCLNRIATIPILFKNVFARD